MKNSTKMILIWLVLLGALLAPGVAWSAPAGNLASDKTLTASDKILTASDKILTAPLKDKIVTGGTFTLASGQTIDGNLYVLGGIVTLERGSYVNGSVILAGGTLQANGEIDGDITAAGGLVSLGDSAVVNGDVFTTAAALNRADGARVLGNVRQGGMSPFQFNIPNQGRVPNLDVKFNPLWSGLWLLLRSFLWAAVATLVVMFVPRQVERAGQAAFNQPAVAIGLGLLTIIVIPLVLVIIAITIIGLPASLLGALLLGLAWAFGMIALGTEVGKQMNVQLKQNWALAVQAAVGTFLLVLVANSLDAIIPCVGWIIPFGVGAFGLGAVLLTRFGTQAYPPPGSAALLPRESPPDTQPER